MKTKKKVSKKKSANTKPSVRVKRAVLVAKEGPLSLFIRLAAQLSITTKQALKAKNWLEYGACMAQLQKAQEEFDKEFPAGTLFR